MFPFLGMRWEDHPALFSFTNCKVTPGPITHCFLYTISSWKSFSSIITWVTCLDWACQGLLVSPQEAYIQWEHQELMVTLQRLLYHLDSGQEENNLSYTVEPPLTDTSHKRTPPISGHKLWSRRFLLSNTAFLTSHKRTPLVSGHRHIFGVRKV